MTTINHDFATPAEVLGLSIITQIDYEDLVVRIADEILTWRSDWMSEEDLGMVLAGGFDDAVEIEIEYELRPSGGEWASMSFVMHLAALAYSPSVPEELESARAIRQGAGVREAVSEAATIAIREDIKRVVLDALMSLAIEMTEATS